jgi:serine/threonine protein kinase
MAPELLNLAPGVDLDSSEYTNAVDMWAMGCVLYRLVLGCVPFPPGPSLVRFCENITSLPLDELPLSPPGITFLKDLLIPSPSARLTAQEALDHTWTTISKCI